MLCIQQRLALGRKHTEKELLGCITRSNCPSHNNRQWQHKSLLSTSGRGTKRFKTLVALTDSHCRSCRGLRDLHLAQLPFCDLSSALFSTTEVRDAGGKQMRAHEYMWAWLQGVGVYRPCRYSCIHYSLIKNDHMWLVINMTRGNGPQQIHVDQNPELRKTKKKLITTLTCPSLPISIKNYFQNSPSGSIPWSLCLLQKSLCIT